MSAEEYLNLLIEQVRCKKARAGIQTEIRNHLEEQQAFFEEEGLESSEAEAMAVKEMGDPIETGVELDRIHRPRMAWGMIALIVVLSLAGHGIQLLLQMRFTKATFLPGSGIDNIIYLLIGFCVMAVICYLDYSWIGRWARAITLFLLAVLALGLLCSGASVNGVLSWIKIGRFAFNVQLLLFLTVPLYGGILYTCRSEGYGVLIKAALWMLPAPLFVLLCPGLTNAVMLVLSYLVVLAAAIAKNWFRISRKLVLTVMGAFAVLLPILGWWGIWFFGADYQRDRLEMLINPNMENGYQLRMVRALIAGSRLFGSDEMAIDQMLSGNSEIVLTYVIYHFGIIAAVLVMAAMAFLFLRFLVLTLRQKNQLGMMMGIGCVTVFIIQMLIYILCNTGVILVISYCPFINYGGSGILVTYALLGLLLSVYRHQNVLSDTMIERKRRKSWKIRLVIEK